MERGHYELRDGRDRRRKNAGKAGSQPGAVFPRTVALGPDGDAALQQTAGITGFFKRGAESAKLCGRGMGEHAGQHGARNGRGDRENGVFDLLLRDRQVIGNTQLLTYVLGEFVEIVDD